MLPLSKPLRPCIEDELGQGLSEYALILVLVSTVATTLLLAFGADLLALFESILDQIPF